MDVLLVNPRWNGRSEIPPLGLECLAALLLKNDFSVSILDLDIESDSEADAALEHDLEKYSPRIVGLTALSNTGKSAEQVCEKIKTIDPDVLTVLGGVHPTVTFDNLLQNCDAVDLVVRGEGEETFIEVLNRHRHGRGFAGVDGVSFREDGKVVHNRDRALAVDLDRYPMPAHHLVANERYKTRSISSSRGCFHRCAFCSIQELYRQRVRLRSVEKINEEIGMLVALGARSIMFTDDNFTFNPIRVGEMCRSFMANGWGKKVEFYAEGRMDDICRNPWMASMLSDAGIRGLYVGAESGSTRILEYYRKGLKPEDIINGVSICVEQNVTPVVSFILLGPRDNYGTIRETIDLAKRTFEMGAEIAYTETLIPYPGTPIQRELQEEGRFRAMGSVYYFQSYEGIDLERFFRLCDLARELTGILHRGDRHFETSKTYYELSYLAEMLEGRVPADFLEYHGCERMRSGEPAAYREGSLDRMLAQGLRSNKRGED